jgi:hypothetical protein
VKLKRAVVIEAEGEEDGGEGEKRGGDEEKEGEDVLTAVRYPKSRDDLLRRSAG